MLAARRGLFQKAACSVLDSLPNPPVFPMITENQTNSEQEREKEMWTLGMG